MNSLSFSQQANVITAEDLEFYRQVKLSKEFKAINDSIEAFNADENNIPQEYKFEITRDKKRETGSDQFISGLLIRKLAIMNMAVDGYNIIYDRHAKKIMSIQYFRKEIEVVK